MMECANLRWVFRRKWMTIIFVHYIIIIFIFITPFSPYSWRKTSPYNYHARESKIMGEGIIIAIIDTGVKAIHPSFSDRNMPPPPDAKNLKEKCSYKGFTCNNKIIGAQAVWDEKSNHSPADTQGHGTHVASIAAGSIVKDANVLGMAHGTMSGMAPMAHLSIYKVCYEIDGGQCLEKHMASAINMAIQDGAHVINLSLSGNPNDTLYQDVVCRLALKAIRYGIVVVASAGNRGPNIMSLSHSAPWVLVVGASTTGRRISSVVELGDGRTFLGESAYQPKNWNSSIMWPLEYPGKNGDKNAICCVPNAMAKLNLKGKIVICHKSCLVTDETKGDATYKAGAEGMVVINNVFQGRTTSSCAHILPAANVDYRASLEILKYYYNQPNTFARIRFDGTQLGFKPSPTVASFSSRGPSRMNGGIIKPDVLAPGVNIMGAWPYDVGPNPDPLATNTFKFLSGTSMAAPYVTGMVAMMKSKHREWTSTAIISAIITTANDSWTAFGDLIEDDSSYKTADIYATGAGVVCPIKAMDPGLVFEITYINYINYICGLGYTNNEVKKIVGNEWNCTGHLTASELNHPSIVVNFTRLVLKLNVSRTAKNVGHAMEQYIAKITEPTGVNVYLSNYMLKFVRVNQKLSYDIIFTLKSAYPRKGSDIVRRGKIVWDSGKHIVTTPIAIRFV